MKRAMAQQRGEDEDILAAVRGERAAWQRLLRRHGPMVYTLCQRLDPDPDDAYQGVWEKVLCALPRFDVTRETPLSSWILTITHRHLIDRHRRRKVQGEVMLLPDIADHSEGAEGRLDRAQRRAALEAALQCLPLGQRRAVVLHHIEGVALDVLAAREEVAVGTIKSRLHRGRARLAALLRAR